MTCVKILCVKKPKEFKKFAIFLLILSKKFKKGDSGGPILKLVNNRWTLVGIVSNGDISCSGTGIYINVPFYYDWILKNIN